MSDYLNEDMVNVAMADLATIDWPSHISLWEDPHSIGQPFDFNDRASPSVPQEAQEARDPNYSDDSTALDQPQPLYPMHSACSDVQASSSLTPPLHDANPHPALASMLEHAPVSTGATNECIECGETFNLKSDLDFHGSDERHSPFACTCGSRFSRRDVLVRHLKTKNNARPQHPCPFCKRHRGKSAFHRKDHLKQHVDEYHKIDIEERLPEMKSLGLVSTRSKDVIAFGCHIPDCRDYRDVHFYVQSDQEQKETAPFTKYSQYTKHLKAMHETTRFPCPVPGCDRVGGKGFQRGKALISHHQSTHPDRPSFVPTSALSNNMMPCPFPNCTEEVFIAFQRWHAQKHL
ncbi:hypothetical protein EDB81DRAFT_755255 [Dactylonectria macrodidyma]|uniref:C2H2-type domain-containing protein n=1 Tax=Dactylonectria macrodidyma TaxID=307937 RepID=A0A9P9JBM2_9HYPO|nr:hypothetical protein EDB81DRAFT_755255 [Dactylonectria macrodidyma]